MRGRKSLISGAVSAVCATACAVAAMVTLASAAAPAPRLKPEAPGPEYMTRLDHARLQTVHTALKKKQFSLAQAELKFVEAPIAKSLGQWFYFMAKDPNVDIAAADAFLDAHPDWPATGRIQAFVESQMSNSDSTAELVAFFDARPPVSGGGKIQYARALLSQGRGDEATALIRDAWINHNFRISEEKRILNAYGARLTKEDHAARVDRLLWARQVTNARRTFPRLNARDRRMAEARAALLLRASTAPRLYRNLPAQEKLDSGVLYAAVRYYRRTDQQQYAISLAEKAPQTTEALRNAGRWWTERRLLMQWALKEGRFADAYALAAQHGGAEGTDFSDAEFVAGWIALRFLNEPERALTHFEAMTGAVGSPISVSRGHYWLGRAAEAAGDKTAASDYYKEAAQHHYSFYGQLAAEKLNDKIARKFATPVTATPADRARFNSRPAVAALRMLSDLNLDYEFMVFAYHIDDQLDAPGEYVELAKFTNGEGAPHLTVRAGKVATRRGAFAAEVSYPTIFVPDEARAFVKPEIVLGLSRQESEFNPRAYSSAGARGVMQLIPSTAQITARKERLPYRRSALLDDPVYNMTIGSAHLSHLLDRFDGSLIMTFAAYNAGAHRATQWAEDYGDPRTSDVDPLDWIELIPFSETRNYVQRVLENIQVYRGQINDSAIPGRLSADIERGGPKGRIARKDTPSRHLAGIANSKGQKKILADLPAQTALLAAAFREERNNQAAPVEAPSIAPNAQPETVQEPAQKPQRRPLFGRSERNNTKAKEYKTKQPVEAAPIALTENAAEPEAADPAEAGDKTQNIVTPADAELQQEAVEAAVAQAEPTLPEAPTISEDLSAPETEAPQLAETAEAQPTEAGAGADLTPLASKETTIAVKTSPVAEPIAEANTAPSAVADQLPVPDSAKSKRAARIIAKNAKRLEIDDDSDDALAAAIARGLQQIEDDAAAPAVETAPIVAANEALDISLDQNCEVTAVEGEDGEASAADLNALMAAQLRGEEDPAAAAEAASDC